MFQEAYKYTFSRTADWHGPINYLRSLPLADNNHADPIQNICVDTLLLVGNMDPLVSMDLVFQSAQHGDRSAFGGYILYMIYKTL